MGVLLFAIIAFFLAVQIYRKRNAKRFFWFFFGLMFVPDNFILFNIPVHTTFTRFLIFMLSVTILITEKRLYIKYKKFPIKSSFIILLIGYLLIGIFDSRLSLGKGIIRSIMYCLDNFSVLFLCYVLIDSVEALIKSYKYILFFFLIFSIYGLFNFFTKSNEFHFFIANTFKVRNFAQDYILAKDGRFRISSFAWHPIYYGFILSIGILMTILPLNILNIKNKYTIISILLLMIINIFLVNSRTPLYSLTGGLFLYLILALSSVEKVKLSLFGVLTLFLLLSIVPKANDLISESFETLNGKSKLEGSSIEMRKYQLAASMIIFYKKPIWGNGLDYITEGLGFSANKNLKISDAQFAGFESYSYKLLIEHGLCGMVANLLFLVYLLIYLTKNIIQNKSRIRSKFAILNLSMLICFILFIFGTGDLGTFKFFFSILGINIAGLESLKEIEIRT